MKNRVRKRVFELRYQGETIGWATIDESGCAIEPANEELDGPLIQRMAGTLAWFIQDASFAA